MGLQRRTTHGEIYNITNGDVFMWEYAWSTIAEAFGMEEGEAVPQKLHQTLPPREAEWVAIVDKYGLRSPRTFEDFFGQGFFHADYTLRVNNDDESPHLQI
jgi:hypothetical protein